MVGIAKPDEAAFYAATSVVHDPPDKANNA